MVKINCITIGILAVLIKAPLYRKKQRHEPISIKTRVLAVLTETSLYRKEAVWYNER